MNPEPLFAPLKLRHVTLPNRLVRSATYEGMASADGVPEQQLAALYGDLAKGGVGTIITGFAAISQQGRAMQPRQTGIYQPKQVEAWKQIVSTVKSAYPDVKILMQIAHSGRQTRREITGLPVVGASSKRCRYFKQSVKTLTHEEIEAIIQDFAKAAWNARQAGFDGVQVHAAHGYLIHQFLSRSTNRGRNDEWRDRQLFLVRVLEAIHERCGADYPLLVKLSGADDGSSGISLEDTVDTVRRLEQSGIDAVEISYGTMEYALNIFRGSLPIDLVFEVNPFFKRIPGILQAIWKRFFLKRYLDTFIDFTENYNIDNAMIIAKESTLPVISVGGFRQVPAMIQAVSEQGVSAVALCRPLICEPDWPLQIRSGKSQRSRCCQCNYCAVYCDSESPLQCYFLDSDKAISP